MSLPSESKRASQYYTGSYLNRHHTMDAYIAAKKNIAVNQTEEDTCVLNYEDEVTRAFGEETKVSGSIFQQQA